MTEKTALPSKKPPQANSGEALPDIPAHIGIIMDGNGRWARRRGQFRTQGHLEGLKAAKRVVKAASELGVSYLTLYTFSTENWKRPAEEVGFIMGLVKQHLRAELDFYRENGLRIRHAGNREDLSEDVLFELDKAIYDTKDFSGLQVVLALNYGGRDEILRAMKKIVSSPEGIQKNIIDKNAINEEMLKSNLDNPDIPDPDLIIRTAGEFRISNFLIWESAYAEFHISDKLWPDWTGDDLREAIEVFRTRDRRFGSLEGAAS